MKTKTKKILVLTVGVAVILVYTGIFFCRLADAQVILTGKKIPIQTLDLSKDEDLTKFLNWGNEYYFEGGIVENSGLKTYPKAFKKIGMLPKTKLFRQEGNVITYMDFKGEIQEDQKFTIGGKEYVLATNLYGKTSRGKVISLETGETSKEEMEFEGSLRILTSPAGKTYFAYIQFDNMFDTWNFNVFDPDGKKLGSAMTLNMKFSSENVLIGTKTYRDQNSSCTYNIFLNLKTGKVKDEINYTKDCVEFVKK